MRMILLLAAALIAAPATAQDNNAADNDAANVAGPAPDANAATPVDTMNVDANAAVPVPMAEPVPADTMTTPASADDDDGFPWGLIGLVGLVGLLGRKRN